MPYILENHYLFVTRVKILRKQAFIATYWQLNLFCFWESDSMIHTYHHHIAPRIAPRITRIFVQVQPFCTGPAFITSFLHLRRVQFNSLSFPTHILHISKHVQNFPIHSITRLHFLTNSASYFLIKRENDASMYVAKMQQPNTVLIKLSLLRLKVL